MQLLKLLLELHLLHRLEVLEVLLLLLQLLLLLLLRDASSQALVCSRRNGWERRHGDGCDVAVPLLE
jgi:hypothetical protein